MPLNISPNSPLIDAANGDSYSVTMSATNGVAPYFWSIASGSLPSGITLSSGGLISGTPSDTPGTYNFNIQVYGSPPYSAANTTTTEAYQLTLLPAITISPASLDDAALGYAYSEILTASGGTGPYTFTKPTGSLPNGLTLSSSGFISGTPTGSAATYNFTIRATDSTGRPSPDYNYSIIVRPRIDIDPDTLPTATVGTAYSQTLSATGGTSPYTWAVTSGSLPAGLTLSGSTISGTPTTEGISVFTIRVRDNRTRNYFWNYIIRTNAAVVVPPSGPPTYFISVNTTTINEGGSAVYSISLTNFGTGFLYWRNIGTTTANDFKDGLNEGSVLITDNTGTLIRSISNDFKTEIVETLDVTLRTGSEAGPVVASTSTVTVNDTSNTPRDIVSGILILDDDFNLIQSRCEEILGAGLDGYGITAIRSTQQTKSNRILSERWNNLIRDLNRINTHCLGTPTDIALNSSGTVITAAKVKDIFTTTNELYFNDGLRYRCYPGGAFPTQLVEEGGVDIAFINGLSTSTSTIWYGSMSHIYRVKWNTPLLARHFFNSGGIFTWYTYYEPGPAESQSDAEWASFLGLIKDGSYGPPFEYSRFDWITTGTTITRAYTSGTKQVLLTAEKNIETDPSLSQYPSELKLSTVFVDTALPAFLVTPQVYNLDPGP